MKTKHLSVSQEEMLYIFDSLFIEDSRIGDIGVVDVHDSVFWAFVVRAADGQRRSNVIYVNDKCGHFIVFSNEQIAECGVDISIKRNSTAVLSLKQCSCFLDEIVVRNLKLLVVKKFLEIMDMLDELKLVIPCLKHDMNGFVRARSLEELLIACDMQLCTSK